MKKTGKAATYIFFLAMLFGLKPIASWASDIQVRLTLSESEILVGEQFRATVEVQSNRSVQVERPSPPQIEGLRYSSVTPSTSTSYSIVNGEATISYGYGFTLVAHEEGSYEIPSFRIQIEGEWYETDPVTVTVHGRAAQQRDAMAQRPEIFLQMELSEDRPFTGQQIIADVVLYFRDTIEINSFQVTRSWSTEGFWQENLSESHSTRAETIFLDGVRYRRAVLTRHALFPTRQGELTLSPFHIRASVRQSSGARQQNQGFFSHGFGRSRNIDLATDVLSVQVSPLPRPERGQFINAIGDLEIRRYLSESEIKLGESVEVITEIRGRGNLNLISRPRYTMPEDFDVFRPQETITLEKQATHIEGKKTFRDVMIARKVSRFSIPAETIAYYDDEARRYRYVELPELNLRVVRDPNDSVGFVSGDVRLHPVTGLANWTVAGERKDYFRGWIWAGLLFPLLILIVAYMYSGYQHKLRTNSAFARYQRAREKAMNKLTQAKNAVEMNQLKGAYTYIHQALYGYISDRLGLVEAGMSDKEIVAHLRQRGLEQSIVDGAFRVLDKCSGIRFAPVGGSDDVIHDIEAAEKIIIKIQKETA